MHKMENQIGPVALVLCELAILTACYLLSILKEKLSN